MSTKKKPAPLRDQIIAFLSKHDEATLKQIAAATTERDFPSRVTTELNKMRTDAAVECAKKPGKNELWYWLATAPQGNAQCVQQPQLAVGKNTSSSASASTPPAEGAVVQPEPAPVQPADVSPAAPVAADETSQSMNDYLLSVIGDIRDAVSDHSSMLSDLPARIRTLWVTFEQQTDDFERIHQILAERVCGGIDPVELSEVECAQRAAQMIDEMLADIPKRDAERRNEAARNEIRDHQLAAAQSQLDQVCDLLADDIDAASIDPADMDAVEMAQAAQRTIRDLRTIITATGAQLPRPEPRGYVVLGDGCVQANFESFETARAIAEEMLENASAISVAVCALQPMVSGRIERRAVWSGQ